MASGTEDGGQGRKAQKTPNKWDCIPGTGDKGPSVNGVNMGSRWGDKGNYLYPSAKRPAV